MSLSIRLLLLGALCCTGLTAYAQPSNNTCETPVILGDVSDYCSESGEFTTVAATPSGYGAPDCFNNDAANDVWFAFVAGATDVTIFVRGDTPTAPGGTLPKPEVALYVGECGGTINELGCGTAATGDAFADIYEGGLIPGQLYYIRVQNGNSTDGTFQLCINNFFPPAEITSDCPTASVLCDKSPFVVESVTSAGVDNTEMTDATCFNNGAPGFNETNSTWFSWICQESGPLTFTLTPISEDDDLDFVVYELPNGLEDCSGKIVRRCMAAGSFQYPSPCMGPTGLAEGFDEIEMDAGCSDAGDENFLAPLEMEQGVAYALVVNNFTSSGNGFAIEFDGLGTFEGPQADFESDEPDNKVCVGEAVEFTDNTAFAAGNVTGWEWTFGVGASPATVVGEGPHTVTYDSPGLKSVVMRIETNLGCILTEVATFTVTEPVELETTLVPPDCGGFANGSIELDITAGDPPFVVTFDGMLAGDQTFFDGLPEDTYPVTIEDAEGCLYTFDIDLLEPGLALVAGVDNFIPPTCTGFSDGALVIAASEGTYPYQYDFGDGLQSDSIRTGLPGGTYAVYVVDAVGCDQDFEVTIENPESVVLNLTQMDVSCFGAADGTAAVSASGGNPGYTFTWSNGSDSTALFDLTPGNYGITVTDANACIDTGSLFINEPPELIGVVLEEVGVLCFEDRDGSVSVAATGGTPGYVYGIAGGVNRPDSVLTGLGKADYAVVITDSRGCTDTVAATVDGPNPIIVDAGPDQEIKLGFGTSLQGFATGDGDTLVYTWSPPDSISCLLCTDPFVDPTRTTDYVLTVTDEDGCVGVDSVNVRVIIERPVFIPNAFSPNGDGNNDRFAIFGNEAVRSVRTFRVFSRWGSLVYEGFNLPLGVNGAYWDGVFKDEILDNQVFAYYAEIEFVDGVVLVYEGDVTLMR